MENENGPHDTAWNYYEYRDTTDDDDDDAKTQSKERLANGTNRDRR